MNLKLGFEEIQIGLCKDRSICFFNKKRKDIKQSRRARVVTLTGCPRCPFVHRGFRRSHPDLWHKIVCGRSVLVLCIRCSAVIV